MFVITVSHGKGGVAKTTTVLSLGAALTENNKRVLLVDVDPQNNLSVAVGLDPENQKQSISNVLFNNMPIVETIQKTMIGELDVITSKSDLIHAEQLLPVRNNYQFILQQKLRDVANIYDFVIIDCSPFPGVVTLNAVVASNLVIIPTIPEMLSVIAIRKTLNLIEIVKTHYNPSINFKILITLYNRRNRTHEEIIEKLNIKANRKIFKSIIGIDTKLRESQLMQKPVTLYAPRSRSTTQYRELAQEVIDYVKERTKQ